MKNVTVNVVNYAHKMKTPLGSMVARREADRGDNLVGLLKRARSKDSEKYAHAMRSATSYSHGFLPPSGELGPAS